MKKYKMPLRRKVALATWSAPREGNIYAKISVNMTKALIFLKEQSKNHKTKITITHLVGLVLAKALEKAPALNSRIFLGKILPNDSVDISFLVSLEDGKNLTNALVENCAKKKLHEIANELQKKSKVLKKNEDDYFNKAQKIIDLLPVFVLSPLLKILGHLTNNAGVDLSLLGLKARPFGSCIITSVGMYGVEEGYAPPTPFANVPLYVAITKLQDEVVAQDKKIVIQPQIKLMITVDHRRIDGHEGALFGNIIKDLLENPKKL